MTAQWQCPPDGWPEDVPWPPPLWPGRYDRWRMLGWTSGDSRITREDGSRIEAGPGVLLLAPYEGCIPP
jgi:hypothetical protein